MVTVPRWSIWAVFACHLTTSWGLRSGIIGAAFHADSPATVEAFVRIKNKPKQVQLPGIDNTDTGRHKRPFCLRRTRKVTTLFFPSNPKLRQEKTWESRQ